MLVVESTKRIGIIVDIEDVGEGEGEGPLDE